MTDFDIAWVNPDGPVSTFEFVLQDRQERTPLTPISKIPVVRHSTGAPQGTVLSPVLFTLYRSDFCYNTESCHMQKFSDDTAIVGCIRNGQEEEYRSLVEDFVQWCKLNHLQLNTSKTKEMVVDFRRVSHLWTTHDCDYRGTRPDVVAGHIVLIILLVPVMCCVENGKPHQQSGVGLPAHRSDSL
ncbi:hypothetical protein AALO_G00078730 [Alosa alosa]|uniref:Reverse transcriptase domain-containing protein n=1 Tax=Alosa alosa TaxID=278164 RepID=A0AAV6H0H1_9TELE|nr:hypothetical protein AALO_G00078730 [Alosa alosa]